MAGTQEENLKRYIRTYKAAKSALETAKKTPYNPTNAQALKDAQRTRDSAWTPVQSAYNTYASSMSGGGHQPKSLDDFLRGEGTSR